MVTTIYFLLQKAIHHIGFVIQLRGREGIP